MKRFDQQLVADYFEGDEKSLEILFGRHLKAIYGFVYRRYAGNSQDAEDITQESFVKAWRNLKKFDQSKSFKAWIFAIAKNTALDFLKKKKAVLFSEFENQEGKNVLMETLAAPFSSLQEILEKSATVEMSNSAMDLLSPSHRLVLSLYYGQQFNFREIAERLGEPLNTVKSRHRRALASLKKSFSEPPL